MDEQTVTEAVRSINMKGVTLDFRPTMIIDALTRILPDNVEYIFARVWENRDLNVQQEVWRNKI